MPASETPTNSTTPEPPPLPSGGGSVALAENTFEESDLALSEDSSAVPSSGQRGARSSSRYVDYDSHELLERISQYEDERRWQRIREGIWISILAHILLFSLLSWIPKYILHSPQVIDPIDAIKQRKDLTYLDELPDALKQIQKLKTTPTLKPNEARVDKKTLEALKEMDKARPKPVVKAPEPIPGEPTPPPTPVMPQTQQQPVPAPPTVATPQTAPQLPQETPRPAPVPAKPNFAMGPQDPADQLRKAMRDSGRQQSQDGGMHSVPLPQLPNAAVGGSQFLSDLQGVDFSAWKQRFDTEMIRSWYPLIPEEVKPPIGKRGIVVVRFKILPSGRVMPGSMTLDGRSGDTALDRAAWGAITSSNYPPMPREFHGPYIEMRATFLYNVADQ
jgi:outer membrane biosynthesis protein TonB